VASKAIVAQRPVPTPPPLPQAASTQVPLQQPLLPQPPPPQPSLAQPSTAQPSPPRQEADDTQSVLARLRQLAPSAVPAQQSEAPPAPDPRPRLTLSPSLSRLSAARGALANGQIEDARRLLQQAQLQLVFGSVDGPSEDPLTAVKGAADVARALDALSANDVPLSRRFVDVAVGDLSGNPTTPPIQETNRRVSGYAPAYPSR
jgi:hypothetical protein